MTQEEKFAQRLKFEQRMAAESGAPEKQEPADEPGLFSRARSAIAQGAGDLASFPIRQADAAGKVLRGDLWTNHPGREAPTGAIPDELRRLTAAASGFAEAGTFGNRDELAAAADTAKQLATSGKWAFGAFDKPGPDNPGIIDRYYANKDAREKSFKDIEAQEPGAALLGAGAAVAPGFFAKAAPAVTGLAAKAWQAAKMGGGQGLAYGEGTSEAKPLKGDVGKFIGDTLVGGAAGAAAGAGLSAVGEKLLKPAVSWLGKKAEDLGLRAIIGNGHQKAQRALNERGIGADLVKFAQDEGVLTPTASPAAREEAAAAVRDRYGKEIGALLDWGDQKANPIISGDAMASEIEALARPRLTGNVGSKAVGNRMLAEAEMIRSRGDMGFEANEEAKRALDPFLKFGAEPSPMQEGLREVRKVLKKGTEKGLDAVAGSLDPAKVGAFQTAKQKFGLAQELSDLAEERLLQLQNNKKLGLTDWLSLIAAGEKGHGALTMLGALATKKAVERFGPASGSAAARALSEAAPALAANAGAEGSRVAAAAARAWLTKLPSVIAADPKKLGKYGPPLTKAARQGPAALAATDRALKDDEDYQALKLDLLNEGEEP